GSALPFVNLIEKTGVRKQAQKRVIREIKEPLWVRKKDMYIVALPGDGFKISYTMDYNHPVIGTLFFEYQAGSVSFSEELAPARTFGFEREVELLQKKGLALGGSLENAVLVAEEDTVNSLRFPDEFIRHKVLDLIGDMALNGYLKGHIIAVKSGHFLNIKLARLIKDNFEERGGKGYDVY
ncbi:MAG TPA: UDP-3-O-acyl-N-acetylglucosamine deacetylase, partial [Halanaerobiales bacterium]|nr:UDP-3-O-acyl-N-acetylglucosamine deacetylase [Halanaerobiales bacterium]